MPTKDELKLLQALPLDLKVRRTEQRIKEWVDEYGTDGVYISFSGGKDSTVLLDIVRNRLGYADIPAVFINTGLEYPEIVKFVQSKDNVVMLKPSMNFKQVLKKYGYPFISKEVAEAVYGARKYLKAIEENTPPRYAQFYRKINGSGEYARGGKSQSTDAKSKKSSGLGVVADRLRANEMNQRLALLTGKFWEWKSDRSAGSGLNKGMVRGEMPIMDRSMFSCEKYKFFLDADFEISNKCCFIMKKQPAHKYAKETGRRPITAQMAGESRLRMQRWLNNGCNGFDMKEPISNPMSFWTEQDVLRYIKENDLEICSVYGEVVATDDEGFEYFNPIGEQKLQTTGCERTGCIYCGFGCHLEKGEGRFERLKKTHPKQYEWIMKPESEGGLGYKHIIDWINEHGNLHIKY